MKSTTAKPCRFESCTNIRAVDPSLARSNAMGRTPLSNSISQAGLSALASITLTLLPTTDPIYASTLEVAQLNSWLSAIFTASLVSMALVIWIDRQMRARYVPHSAPPESWNREGPVTVSRAKAGTCSTSIPRSRRGPSDGRGANEEAEAAYLRRSTAASSWRLFIRERPSIPSLRASL